MRTFYLLFSNLVIFMHAISHILGCTQKIVMREGIFIYFLLNLKKSGTPQIFNISLLLLYLIYILGVQCRISKYMIYYYQFTIYRVIHCSMMYCVEISETIRDTELKLDNSCRFGTWIQKYSGLIKKNTQMPRCT